MKKLFIFVLLISLASCSRKTVEINPVEKRILIKAYVMSVDSTEDVSRIISL